ncbi:MAG: serine hydrolase [Planctomycetes bacterium]|nr:serine hydrolase [Planctomycetota bacterium]
MKKIAVWFIGFWAARAAVADKVTLQAPPSAPRFDAAEFTVRVQDPPFQNPFTEVQLEGTFTPPGGEPIRVDGFCDSRDGSVFRLRFSPQVAGAAYAYALSLKSAALERRFEGTLRCEPSDRPGPVAVDPEHRKRFIHAGSRKPFYHLGYTAYHLLDPSNDDAQVDATIDYCARNCFNKIRFLLAGYPRDLGRRASSDPEQGVPDPWKAPNYGARPGQVNPLPAWVGEPHRYDFTRFNAAHWQRADRAVRRMRDRGIVATAIFTIEKQDLPKEYGRLSEHELRFYRYAVARLAAFDNVWWDLGNEHNEFRDADWGNAMGALVKERDPYDRLASAHAYDEFFYGGSSWADFIIVQQYGDERRVHDWALKHLSIPKPFVNEEYGYEGSRDQPGHGQNGERARRCHWAIAMAGGYATYGDWSGGTSWFYMGEPGPGKAALELVRLRAFFEELPFNEFEPRDALTTNGFCLARPGSHYVFYFPQGGEAELDLSSARSDLRSTWFDPRAGERSEGPRLQPGKNRVAAPAAGDWALLARVEEGTVPAAPAAATTSPARLEVQGPRFLLNGQPAFLLGCSYYGALGAPEEAIRQDLDDLGRHGFNWIRVWATWAAFGGDVSAVDGEGNERQPYLDKLRWLISECGRRGLAVDVTLSRGNGATGPARLRSLEAHRRAVETLVAALRPLRNWYLDLANERNIADQRHVPFEELKALRGAVKRLDPERLVTASHGGDLSRDELKEYLLGVQADFVSPHRPRHARSARETEAKAREVLAWMRGFGRVAPLHYQEPFRRGYGEWQPAAGDFLADLEGARRGGAAGWCFHNGGEKGKGDGRPRRSFDLREKRLFEQLDEEERKAMATLPQLLSSLHSGGETQGRARPAWPRIAISGGRWQIDGEPTYRGSKAEGLLLNVRMVNALFEDRRRPDFDPEANTEEFIAEIPSYASHGIRAFTLNLQGGMPGYEGAVNSAFNPDGSLREEYLKRARRAIEACGKNGAAVILGCFYQRQDQILKDGEAVRAGVRNAARWIRENGWTHVLLEIANEFNHGGFDHPILKTPEGEAELTRLAREAAPGLLVSTSGLGDGLLPEAAAAAGDFLLIHFNGTPLEKIPERIAALRKFGKPIVCNEDEKTGELGAKAAELCAVNGASWGLMLFDWNQKFPFQFKGAADDPIVYGKLKELTAPAAAPSLAAAAYFPPPESQGGWRKLETPEEARQLAGMDPEKLAALKEWLLQSDDRDFAAVVVRRGYIVLEVERGKSARSDTGNVKSCAKAICATVMAIAAEESARGRAPRKMSFQDQAFSFIPWAQPLSDPRKSEITVAQLLNHTSGLTPESSGAHNSGPWQWILGHAGDPKTARLAFDPGKDLDYTTHGFYHAALVIENVTGEPYDRFAIEKLFKPLGIEHWWFEFFDGDERHGRHPSHALGLPARDLARIAYCMVRNGEWGGRQVVPRWFVEATGKPSHAVTGTKSFQREAQSFSLGWELPARLTGERGQGIPPDARFKPGSGGQLIAFIPSLDVILARQTGDSGPWAYEDYVRRAAEAAGERDK